MTVIYSGKEVFASGADAETQMDLREWLDRLDFSGLKIRLIASIVAISTVSLLREFVFVDELNLQVDSKRIGWMLALHLAFVASAILLAGMDPPFEPLERQFAARSHRGALHHGRLVYG